MKRTQQYITQIRSLHRWYKEGELNLNPSYQRPYAWIDWQKEELIKSILEFIPVNAIFLTEDSGRDIRDVIDGKQRLTTIFEYMDGVFIIALMDK